MLITCPSCAAEYNVPGPLAPGRSVRCARCSTQWAPVAAPEPPTIDAVAASPVPPPSLEPPAPAAPRLAAPAVIEAVAQPAKPAPLAPPRTPRVPGRLPLLVAWGGSVLLLILLLAAAAAWRDPIMRAWPPSERVYGALGLSGASVAGHP